MKIKKILVGIVLATAMLLVTGCGMNNKQAFLKNLSDKNLFDAQEMTINVKDLKFEGDTSVAYLNMLANQLKDLSIEASTSKDPENDLTKTNVTLKTLGLRVPFEVITDSKSVYLSTDFMNDLMNLANSFSYGVMPFEKAKLAQLKGKYVDLSEYMKPENDEKNADGKKTKGSKSKTDETKNPFKSMTDLPTDKLSAELKKTMESFDKDSFKKDGDVLTHTFTNDEIIKILETYDKVFKEDKETKKDYKDSEAEKTMKEALQALKDKTLKLEVKVALNEKAKTTDTELRIDAHQKDLSVKMVLTANTKAGKKETTIDLPNKKDILSPKEFEKIFGDIGSTYDDDDEEEPDDDYDSDEMLDPFSNPEDMDKYLEIVIDEINESKGKITEEEAEIFREGLSDHLNKEQMKRLNDALDKALQTAV